MIKVLTRLAVLIIVLMTGTEVFGQVEIGSTNYTTLYAAFNAINGGIHTGDIVVKITNNITETSTAVLQSTDVGNADYTSITIYPTGTYKIQGNLSNGIIQLQGADNVTIDGRVNMNGSTPALTFKNTATSGYLIRFDSLTSGDPANYNKILYCNLEHSSKTGGYGVTFGVSNSATGSASSTGNEVGYCTFKNMVYGIRIYSASDRILQGCKIYNNTFGSSNLAESVGAYGIYIYYTKNVEIYGNTFEYLDYTSTIYAINAAYSESIKIYDNIIQNITGPGGVYSISVSQSPYSKVYGNTINNIRAATNNYVIYLSTCATSEVYNNSVNNVYGGASTMYCIYLSSAATSKVNNNTVKNAVNASAIYMIALSSCASSEVKNNVLDNQIMTTNGTTSYGIYLSSSAYTYVWDNKISNLMSAGPVYSIYATSCTESNFNKNYIDKITSYGTSATGAVGLNILSSNTSVISNNSISNLITTQYSASNNTSNPFGILIQSGTGYKIYYNSVYLSGKQLPIGTSGSRSACLMMTSTAINTFDLRNNNFVNDLEGAAGSQSFAIYIAGTGNLTNSTLDYNNYYVGGAYGILGFLTSNQTTLALWKTATSREGNSRNLNPLFNSVSLLAPFTGSPVLGKGIPISGYTTDITGAYRSSTASTIGAYENADDIVGPTIVYTKPLTTASSSNRFITATITDIGGLNTSTSEPRIYYRKTSASNTFISNSSATTGWKYSSGIQNGNDFTFEIDYSKINGYVSTGDVIEYFIIAQDASSKQNITVTSGTFSQAPTSTSLAASNFPVTNADSYRLAAAITGNYNVGSSQTYTSLTKPDGFFNFLNNNIVTGDVFVNITSNLTETGEIALGKLQYEGGTFTIKIQPNTSTKRTVSGEVYGTLIKLIGVSNVTIDGSYNGSGRYLEFYNSAQSTTNVYRAVLMIGSGDVSIAGGKNIAVKNTIIYNGNRLNYSFGIILSDGALSTSVLSLGINNLQIKNNKIYNSTYGMMLYGGSSAGNMVDNLLVEDNIIGDDSKSTSILSYGIYVQYCQNGNIRHNLVYNFDGGPNNTNTIYGIYVATTGSVPTYIENNTIKSLNYQGTSVCTINAIYYNGSYGVIRNNFISEILTTAYTYTSPSNYHAVGIRVGGSYTKVWHNTVYMTGEMKYYTTSTDYGGFSANIFVGSSYSGNDFRGNILHNSVYKAASSTYNPEAYNIWFYTTNDITTYFDQLNNNVYSVGNGAKVGGYGQSTFPFPYYAYNLSDWQAKTMKDVNSKTGLPEFVNSTDMHINGTSIGNSFYMYSRMAEVLTDADGENRNATTYYGADEVKPVFALTQDTKLTPDQPVLCVNDAATISFNPEVTGFEDGVTRSGLNPVEIKWYKNGTLINGANNKYITFNPVTMGDSAKFYATGYFMGQTLTGSQKLIKVETPMTFISHPYNTDICNNNPQLIYNISSKGNINSFQWEFKKAGTTVWTNVTGQISPTLNITINDNGAGDYRLKMTGPGNCGSSVIYSNSANVTYSYALHNVVLHQTGKSAGKDLTHVCEGEDLNLNVTDEGTVYGYVWQKDMGSGFVDLSLAQYPTANSPNFSIINSNPGETGTYRCKVLGSASCGTSAVYTQPVSIRIWPYFSLDEQPQSQTICLGESSFIRINTSGTVYSYQWFKNGTELTAADNEFFNKPVLYFNDADFDMSGTYKCRVQSEDCFGFLDFISEEASIYVITNTEIILPPITQTVVSGGNVNFRVKAHVNGAPENYKPAVQWYKGNTPLVEGGRFIGTKSDMLMITNVQESDFGEDYNVIVNGQCGSDKIESFGLLKGSITITEQPANINGCEDEEIILKVDATTTVPGEILYYKWYKNGQELNECEGISGTSTKELKISSANSSHPGSYYAVVKLKDDKFGTVSNEVNVNVVLKPKITKQPETNLYVIPGKEIKLSVEALGEGLRYQWYFENSAIVNEQSSTLSIENATEANSGKYNVDVINDCGAVMSLVSNVFVTTNTTEVNIISNSEFKLGNISPNPVLHTAEIKYHIPYTTKICISLYNELGSKIEVLSDGLTESGDYSLSFNPEKFGLTAGVYNLVLKSSEITLCQKFIVIR